MIYGHIQTQEVSVALLSDTFGTERGNHPKVLDSISLSGKLVGGEYFVVELTRQEQAFEPAPVPPSELSTMPGSIIGNARRSGGKTRAFVKLPLDQFDRLLPLVMTKALRTVEFSTLLEPSSTGVDVLSISMSTNPDFYSEDEDDFYS